MTTQNPHKKPEQTLPPINKDDLHPKEVALIKLMREKFRFGRIVVIVHDGIPQKIEETVKYEAL